MIDLKPCPWCAGADLHRETYLLAGSAWRAYVLCRGCAATGPDAIGPNDEAARDAADRQWNLRAEGEAADFARAVR